MERYKVTVHPPGGGPISTVVPFRSESSVEAFSQEVLRRASKRIPQLPANATNTSLHLGGADGPFLDLEDHLQDVVIAPETEHLFLLFPAEPPESESLATAPPSTLSLDQTLPGFKIRVVTPHLARAHEHAAAIPLLGSGRIITDDMLLREIISQIAQELGILTVGDVHESAEAECNCALAALIETTIPKLESSSSASILPMTSTSHNTSHSFVLVSGRSSVEWIQSECSSYQAALRERFGEHIEQKKYICTRTTTPVKGATVEIVSLCSHTRHNFSAQAPKETERVLQVLDIHTVEGPIQTSNFDLTMRAIGLASLAVNGIVTLYAVERRAVANTPPKPIGKAAFFKATEHWKPQGGVSDRGLSAFLSCLRVFAEMISARQMDEEAQNMVLHVTHSVTRFPPALRALHILMDGKSMAPCECAALVQSFTEVLKDIVPQHIIRADTRRLLEASRLLFGTLISLARNVDGAMKDKLPYLKAYKTLDLRDIKTNQPVVNPVQSELGLMEKGCYECFTAGGLLSSNVNESSVQIQELSAQTRRVILLHGGLNAETTFYDHDALQAALLGIQIVVAELGSQRDMYLNLHHLAALSEQARFSVVSPRALAESKVPSLTLDRDGLMAVYVGRPPCAAPGQDITIFLPLDGREDNIDVAIVTQLIEPIVQSRQRDGTSIFDFFGASPQCAVEKPAELVMVCVDCSTSMDEASDFHEISGVVDEDEDISGMDLIDDTDGGSATLQELKDMLRSHESFDDMLAIINATSRDKRVLAVEILEYLSLVSTREKDYRESELRSIRSWATSRHYRQQYERAITTIAELRQNIIGLTAYRDALGDYLLFEARGSTSVPWAWQRGDAMPSVHKSVEGLEADGGEFEIPYNIRCPIGHCVFEHPVTASDGFNYERRLIDRWFQIRKSSPSTGLDLVDTTLRHNQALQTEATRWIAGEDIATHAAQPPPKKTRPNSQPQRIRLDFTTPVGSFTRHVAVSTTFADLHELVFRGMRGLHEQFELYCRGALLRSSSSDIKSASIRTNSTIVVRLGKTGRAQQSEFEDMCLIRVFDRDDAELLFSYWVTTQTSVSALAVIFRYWRHSAETEQAYRPDVEVWYDGKYAGDRVLRGTLAQYWAGLSEVVNSVSPSGTRRCRDFAGLQDASMYQADTITRNANSDEEDNSDADEQELDDTECFNQFHAPSRAYSPHRIGLAGSVGSRRTCRLS